MSSDVTNDVPLNFIFAKQKVKLDEQLGKNVYKAVLLDTNEAAAVKDVFTDDDKKVVASCRSLCKKLIALHSDYIVRFIGMSESPKHFYFVTELATGGSLMQALQSHPMRDDLATLLRWALSIVSGLAYLHSQQPPALHLDIKPQNVLLFGCGLAKLCDFGISQVTEHTQAAAREGATYRYAAPEQLLDGGMVSAATDIYGLGGVLYVMALKKEPWYDIRKPLEIVHKHIAGEGVSIPSPLPPDCHACIMAIAAECLHRNPQDRPTLEQVQGRLLRSLLCDVVGASAPPNADAAKACVLDEQLSKAVAERDSARQEADILRDAEGARVRRVSVLEGELSKAVADAARVPVLEEQLAKAIAERDSARQVQRVVWTVGAGAQNVRDTPTIESLFAVGGSFQTLGQQMVGFRLRSIQIVQNNNLENSLKTHLERMKATRQGDATLFHHECQNEEQREVLRVLKALFHPVLAAARRDPRTLTVYHGCRASVALKIVNGGLVDLSSNDSGYFGHGIYVTPNAEYACQYAKGVHGGAVEPHPEHPDWFAVLLCTAAVGLVYPVTRQIDYQPPSPSGHSNLFGKPLKPRYDAHFALVHHTNGYEAAELPVFAQYGELCVSQYAALLPHAILWVSPT